MTTTINFTSTIVTGNGFAISKIFFFEKIFNITLLHSPSTTSFRSFLAPILDIFSVKTQQKRLCNLSKILLQSTLFHLFLSSPFSTLIEFHWAYNAFKVGVFLKIFYHCVLKSEKHLANCQISGRYLSVFWWLFSKAF